MLPLSLIILLSVWLWLFVGTWHQVRSQPAQVRPKPFVENPPEIGFDAPSPSLFRQCLNLLTGLPFAFAVVVIAASAQVIALFIFWPALVAGWIARRNGS